MIGMVAGREGHAPPGILAVGGGKARPIAAYLP